MVCALTSIPRGQVALQEPPADLSDYPHKYVERGRRWFREHGPLGPWFFACTNEGRFNLEAPLGTLYLASGKECSARERVGIDLANGPVVPSSIVADRWVSELELQEDVRAARLTHPDALNWQLVASELMAITPYDLPRKWASAFEAAGFGGLWGRLRFTNANHGRGLSVFGPKGTRPTWPTDPDRQPLRTVLQEMRVRVEDPPLRSAVTVIDP